MNMDLYCEAYKCVYGQASRLADWLVGSPTDRQPDWPASQTGSQTDRQPDRQAARQTGSPTDRQPDRQAA